MDYDYVKCSHCKKEVTVPCFSPKSVAQCNNNRNSYPDVGAKDNEEMPVPATAFCKFCQKTVIHPCLSLNSVGSCKAIERSGTSSATSKDKRKAGKLRVDYISPIALVALADLMTKMGIPKEEGGKGYEPHDWQYQTTVTELLAAMHRHALKMQLGEDYDKESGSLHATCIMFAGMALTHIMLHTKLRAKCDDRGELGKASDFPEFYDYLADVGVTTKVPVKEKTDANQR